MESFSPTIFMTSWAQFHKLELIGCNSLQECSKRKIYRDISLFYFAVRLHVLGLKLVPNEDYVWKYFQTFDITAQAKDRIAVSVHFYATVEWLEACFMFTKSIVQISKQKLLVLWFLGVSQSVLEKSATLSYNRLWSFLISRFCIVRNNTKWI
jgi:hypothetical protein